MPKKSPICIAEWTCASSIDASSQRAAAENLAVGWLVDTLGWLLVRIGMELRQQNSGLGAEPSEALLHYLGEWALIMLLFAFAVSPLRRRMGWLALGRNRPLVGLFAFTYVALHVLTYVGLYAQFQLAEVVDDFVHRPYITVGIAAFLALSLMAVTSTQGWRRRLQKNWQRLHG